MLRRSPMSGRASKTKDAGKTPGSNSKTANEKAKKRPRNTSKSGLTPEAKTKPADQGGEGEKVIQEIDDLLDSCEVDGQADRKLVREAKLKLHGGEVDMNAVEEVGRPPLEDDDDTDSAADQEDGPEIKRVRSDVEVRVYRWEGAKKSITQEQWNVVYGQLTVALLDPRNAKLLEEVQNRDRPITNTSGNLRYGVVGAATEDGAKEIRALLHNLQFKRSFRFRPPSTKTQFQTSRLRSTSRSTQLRCTRSLTPWRETSQGKMGCRGGSWITGPMTSDRDRDSGSWRSSRTLRCSRPWRRGKGETKPSKLGSWRPNWSWFEIRNKVNEKSSVKMLKSRLISLPSNVIQIKRSMSFYIYSVCEYLRVPGGFGPPDLIRQIETRGCHASATLCPDPCPVKIRDNLIRDERPSNSSWKTIEYG